MGRVQRYKLFGIWIFIGVCWGIVLPTGSYAARPLVTEDTDTVEKGATEVEIAFETAREENRDKYYIPSLQVAYGLTERIEIAAGVPYIFLEPHENGGMNGLGDAYAYLKYRVWGEGEKYPAFTIKPFVKFPTASEERGLGSGKADLGMTAVFGKSFPGFNLYFDGTYVLIGEKNIPDEMSVGLAGEFEIIKRLNLVSEIRYGNNFNAAQTDDPAIFVVGLTAGVGMAVFDAAVTLGLNHAAPDYIFTVGVTLHFK